MENIYKASKTILLFVVMVLVAQMVAGDKFTQNMCIVLLASMMILNSGVFTKSITAITNNLTENF